VSRMAEVEQLVLYYAYKVEKIILLEFEKLAIFQLYSLMSNVSLRWSISQSVSLNEASLAMVSIADSILN
jgi:hypothetical protein